MLENDDETLFILSYIYKILFKIFYLTQKNVTVIFVSKYEFYWCWR